MSKYFFSYAGVYRPSATDVVSGLQSADIDVWWDQNGIGWGEDWQDKLQEGLMTCDAYILLLGKQGIRRWVKPEVEIALCRHYENDLPLFLLLHKEVDRQDIPPFLSCIQHRSLPDNLNDPDFFADLAKELKQQTDDPSLYAEELEPGFCPFPGLESFTEDRADFFFGRQRETAELLLRFARPNAPFSRWLQIEGNSGVGKSSLVQSGLVPAIRKGWLDESHERYDWHVLLMRPGSDPCQNLFVQLCQSDFAKSPPPSFPKQVELIKDANRQDVTDLALALKLALPKDSKAKVLLIIDQLEEVITLTTNAKSRQRFDSLLAAALKDPDCPLYLVTTIRSDFMLHFAELPALQKLLNSPILERYFLKPIGSIGLADAIKSPVRRAKGWSWQPGTRPFLDKDLTLPERIIEEALNESDAALPLAANVMKMLWEMATAKKVRELSFDDLKTLNGVGGALARTLDSKLQRLPKEDKERARAVLLELVQSNLNASYTRRTITKTQALKKAGAEKDAQAADRILNWLSGIRVANDQVAEEPVRMIVISGGKENESDKEDKTKSNDAKNVDLIHEILLRKSRFTKEPFCKSLSEWIEKDRKQLNDRTLRQHLADDWSEMRQKSHFQAWINYLASWRQLQDFKNAGTCSKLEQDFLNASAQRLKLILWVVVLAIIPFTHLVFSATGTKVSAQYANLASWLIHIPTAWARATIFDSPKLPNMVDIPKGQLLISEHNKTINVSGFNMAKTELTFAEYDIFVFANRAKKVALVNAQQVSSQHPECFELPEDYGFGRGDRPVIDVSWDCAIEYIAWLNEQPGLKGYRLPSETEWEYAIRANAKPQTDYYWGDQGEAKDFAWFSDNSGHKTHPVAEKKPNAFGLYDMSGNVWEWVQDCYDENYSSTPTNGTAWNPQECKDSRVLRGGSWSFKLDDLRSAFRYRFIPDIRLNNIGFRLAQD